MQPHLRVAPLALFALSLGACADPIDDDPDAGAQDAAVDAGVSRDAATPDAEARDAGEADAGEFDAGHIDAGPRVVEIAVAYAATTERRLLAELYLTETSTSRVKVTPDLAGGPEDSGEGDLMTGVDTFEWTASGDLLYAAQQDTYDRYEIYLAEVPGSQRFSKLSVEGGGSDVRGWSMAPTKDWLTFAQVPDEGSTRGQRFAVRVQSGAVPVQISVGSGGIPLWSPTSPELAFQDIIVSADDRDLWHVNLAVDPPARTRAHPGANIGFGGYATWSADGTRLAFAADETALRLFEPFQVTIRGGVPGPATRVTAAFDANADVTLGERRLAYDPTGSKLAFIADTETDNLEELFVLDPTGALPAATTKLNLGFPAAAGADGVDRFIWSADGAKILYAADHATPNVHELYLTAATGPTGVRVNEPLAAGESVEHEAFVRGDSMVIYTQYDGAQRRLHVVDISGATPAEPVDLGPIHPFFPSPRYDLSPSEDYVIFEDFETPPMLHLARLTGTPTVTASFEAWQGDLQFLSNWCWGPQDELLIVKADGHLYLVEDKDEGETFRISGDLAPEGRVTGCAFPPR